MYKYGYNPSSIPGDGNFLVVFEVLFSSFFSNFTSTNQRIQWASYKIWWQLKFDAVLT